MSGHIHTGRVGRAGRERGQEAHSRLPGSTEPQHTTRGQAAAEVNTHTSAPFRICTWTYVLLGLMYFSVSKPVLQNAERGREEVSLHAPASSASSASGHLGVSASMQSGALATSSNHAAVPTVTRHRGTLPKQQSREQTREEASRPDLSSLRFGSRRRGLYLRLSSRGIK